MVLHGIVWEKLLCSCEDCSTYLWYDGREEAECKIFIELYTPPPANDLLFPDCGIHIYMYLLQFQML